MPIFLSNPSTSAVTPSPTATGTPAPTPLTGARLLALPVIVDGVPVSGSGPTQPPAGPYDLLAALATMLLLFGAGLRRAALRRTAIRHTESEER